MAEDGKATLKIPVYIPNFRDEDGNNLQRVEYYFIARHSEAEPLDGSKAPKVVDEMADRVLEMHILQNLTFATGKSFIRASEAGDLKALGQAVQDWKAKHSDCKLAVFGHADAVGDEGSNKSLSERRAKSVQAYLAKDAKPWEALYGEEKWGLAAVQELLKHLGHDAGAIDGQDGPKTQGAVKDFQEKQGIGVTGAADAKTREALFLAYFESNAAPACDAKEFDAIDGKSFTGCSEFNLIENTQGACETNRRVAVLLLKVSKNFPIHYPCKQGAIMPCQKQAGLKGERRTPGFKCRFYDNLVVEKKGAGPTPVGKLKWVGVKEGEDLKQYVNLAADKPGQGPERTLEIEVEGGSDGAKLYWKVTAGKDNSKRNDPKPGLKPDTKGKLTEFKDGVAELEIEVKGGKASLVLACGLAGGDSFKVEVGLGKGKADGTVSVVNWRKLEYEIHQPLASGNNRLTDYTVFNPDKSPGLPEKSRSSLDKVLGSNFVEFNPIFAGNFGKEDLAEDGKHNIIDAHYLGKNKGNKALVLSFGQLRNVLNRKAVHRSERKTVSMVWCDYIAKVVDWEQEFDKVFKQMEVSPKHSVFERTIDAFGAFSYGDYSITKLKWKASRWYDESASGGKGEWKPILSPSDPGGAFISGGVFTSEEDIKAHVEFKGIRTLSLKFPAGKHAYPGNSIPRDSDGQFFDKGKVIGLSIIIVGAACKTNTNGAALQGDIWMNTFAGEVDPVGMAMVIAHELGHNMGQAYANSSVDSTFGRPLTKPIPGYPFPKGVPEGDVYGEHGHIGTHCAKGLKDKTVSDFQTDAAFKERTCIMFGASDMAASTEYAFCEDCSTYIRAEDLQDIRKSWTD
ncbi:MAG: peptidoglycan-binding protein [Fibrobacteres bacterium]|nr:peptidoglycan-binding protein [Fibrobacterota bacterium]